MAENRVGIYCDAVEGDTMKIIVKEPRLNSAKFPSRPKTLAKNLSVTDFIMRSNGRIADYLLSKGKAIVVCIHDKEWRENDAGTQVCMECVNFK